VITNECHELLNSGDSLQCVGKLFWLHGGLGVKLKAKGDKEKQVKDVEQLNQQRHS
jgi:hypothetical protein